MWRSTILLSLFLASPVLAQTSSASQEPISCDQESGCLIKLPEKVRRDGDVLILTLDNGQVTNFKTNRQACENDDADNCMVYELRSYRPTQRLYVVEWAAYEGRGAILVSTKTGELLGLPTIPIFSPSGQRFVAFKDEDYDPTYEVSIWSILGGEAKQEFRYKAPENALPEGWNAIDWDGESRVVFKVFPLYDEAHSVETDAVLKEQGWVLNWPSPK